MSSISDGEKKFLGILKMVRTLAGPNPPTELSDTELRGVEAAVWLGHAEERQPYPGTKVIVLTEKGLKELNELQYKESKLDNGMQDTELFRLLKIAYNSGNIDIPETLGTKLRDINCLYELGLIEYAPRFDDPIVLTEAGRKILWFMNGGILE